MGRDFQEKTLRVGVAGCGKVAEHHARFLSELPCARLVAVADRNLDAARDYAARHRVADTYSSVEDMLNGAKLDVLHVITPPSFHYECARAALERGVHVFVEKPVAFTAAEVSDLYELAARRQVQLCPDFIQLFHPRMQQLLLQLQSGTLGRVLHVDSYLAFNLTDSPELRESEGLHWAYRLPGGLLRDYASHVLYLALYFAGRPQQVQVSEKSLGSLPQGMVDHLAIQVAGANCTASVLLSSALQSSAYGLRLTCEKGTAEVNFETQSLVIKQAGALPRR
ncbi:MAG TPA: Gfo/Idh/MocA family oxidoreductase, partial [Terriglobales bacterium]|nr:Gfo/Idh/MocA family oxidoreductase [Terriglobales bacterium]